MNFIDHVEKIKIMHELISSERTGSPNEFAKKMEISKKGIYNTIIFLKNFDAPIRYCAVKRSFYYSSFFDLELKFSIKIINEHQTKITDGGFDYGSVLLDGSQAM